MMIKTTTELSLKKDAFILSCFILFCLFIPENSISLKKWNRDYITVDYTQLEIDGTIKIKFEFFDYEFGPRGEHGYMFFTRFFFSTDGLDYQPLIDCYVNDQVHKHGSFVELIGRLKNAKIEFIECKYPASGSIWAENTLQKVVVDNLLNKAYVSFKWYVDSKLDVQAIKARGHWHVNGLNCGYNFTGEIYKKQNKSFLNTNIQTDSKQNYANIAATDHPENNKVMVYTDPDAVVIKGPLIGENINFYNVSGVLIKSIVSNNESVKISLPRNQIYIVQIGQTSYKVALSVP